MTVTTNSAATEEAFVHPALFYRGWQEYLAGTVPFIRDGLAAGEPVAVAVPPPNLAVLREEMGSAAGSVRMLDMTQVGRNPGRIIPGVLRAFADAHPDGHVRIIGEPIWAGRSALEYPACVQHEALINLAFTGRQVTILCPYDADRLDPVVLADAEATHPVLINGSGEWESRRYEPEQVVSAYNRPLPAPPADAASFTFDVDCLAGVRNFAGEHAAYAGLPDERQADLKLLVNELACNSIVHGGGSGVLRTWVEKDRFVAEVTDAGHLRDPLAGRIPVALDSGGGRGLLLLNFLSDLVRVHTGDAGTTIRMYLDL
jgi:anti-sigma regulatory factor (Ser/Thr protein kinase)